MTPENKLKELEEKITKLKEKIDKMGKVYISRRDGMWKRLDRSMEDN